MTQLPHALRRSPGVPAPRAGPDRDHATSAPVDGSSEAQRLDHLRALEAESLHIIREVVAEFARPVMLYSIGKDSSVMLRLAQKAFYPAPIPFPLLHVDTTYKFREMIDLPRPLRAAGRGAAHRPHEQGGDRRRHAALRGRHAALLRPAQDQVAARRARGRRLRRGVWRRPARRGALARQGAHLLAARPQGPVGSEAAAARALAPPQQPHPAGREHPRLPALELDRARRLALHRGRADPGRPALLRAGARRRRPRQLADAARAGVRAAPARASAPSA